VFLFVHEDSLKCHLQLPLFFLIKKKKENEKTKRKRKEGRKKRKKGRKYQRVSSATFLLSLNFIVCELSLSFVTKSLSLW